MAFNKANRPRRPGSYVRFIGTEQAVVAPSVGSIVAVPITHDWGPYKENRLVTSLQEFQSVYGPSTETAGYLAVRNAFLGEGLPGRGGAGGVLVHRFGGSAALKATKTLQNTTPAAALVLNAKYEGTYGNDLKVTVQDFAADTTQDELILFVGATEMERYRYANTDIAGLAAQINTNSRLVAASVTLGTTALAPISATVFTAGNDGSTVIAGDWTAMMTALEPERFSLFSPFDLTDTAIVASLKTWAQNMNAGSKRFMTVLGGALDETITTAALRATTLNDPDFVTVGVGSVWDDDYPDVSGNPTVLSSSQLAPRIAGILAARGEAMSITFARLAGIRLKVAATEAQILTAFDSGLIVLGRDSHVDAPVRIEKALTSWTTKTDLDRPYELFRNPKNIRINHGIELEFGDWGNAIVIGQLPVNDKTRDAAIGFCQSRLRAREVVSVVQPGWTAQIDPDPPPSDDDEFIALLIGISYGRTTEQIYFTIRTS